MIVICLDHAHELSSNPLSFPRHRQALQKWQDLMRIVRRHRQAVIPYSESRRVLESESCFPTADRHLGECHCSILLRYGIACKHHLKRAYLDGQPIPKSLLHPRWWLKGPTVRYTGWKPSYPEDDVVDYGGTVSLTTSSHTVADEARRACSLRASDTTSQRATCRDWTASSTTAGTSYRQP